MAPLVVAATDGPYPKVGSLSNFFLYFKTSAGSVGSLSFGQPPYMCLIALL